MYFSKRVSVFRTGFTLIELLVVIAILGILMAIGLSSFTGAQRNARDSRRRSDIKAMQAAFEQYYASNGAYTTCTTMATEMPGGLPVDPQVAQGSNYTCFGGLVSGQSTYCACARLEKAGSGNATAPSGAGNRNCNLAAGGDYYCATALQ